MTDGTLVRPQPGRAEWAYGRVVYCSGFENHRARPRGFESLYALASAAPPASLASKRLRGGMVDTLYLGCKRCGFESRRGQERRQVAERSNAGAC